MKITHIETVHVKPRWLFLRIHVDTGIVGLGEATLEGRSRTVETALRELEPMLIGQDPRRIEHLWQTMYRGTFYRGGPVLTSAISGVEQALWDILGKSLGVPVHQLLGGTVRDRIRVYGWIHAREGETWEQACRRALAGTRFTAFKIGPVPASRFVETPAVVDDIAARVAVLREIAGKAIDIAVDFHGRCSGAMAIRLARLLEPYQPMFIEEPVLPGDTEGLKHVARSTTIPIAAGERLMTRWQFQELIEQRAVSILQPDLSHVGGIFEARKIAAAAEPRNMAVAPHCPLGPVALAASLQLDACTPNFLCQEHVTLGQDYLKTPFTLADGYVEVPRGPGLGIDLDDDKVEAGRFEGDWQTPRWSLEDGSFAEW